MNKLLEEIANILPNSHLLKDFLYLKHEDNIFIIKTKEECLQPLSISTIIAPLHNFSNLINKHDLVTSEDHFNAYMEVRNRFNLSIRLRQGAFSTFLDGNSIYLALHTDMEFINDNVIKALLKSLLDLKESLLEYANKE